MFTYYVVLVVMLFGCHVVWLYVFFAEDKRNHSAIHKTTKPQNHKTTNITYRERSSVFQGRPEPRRAALSSSASQHIVPL